MRLLVIQDYLRAGGTEAHAIRLVAVWKAAGQEVQLLTFRPGGELLPRARAWGVEPRVLQKVDTGIHAWAPGLSRAVRDWDPQAILLLGRSAHLHGAKLKRKFPGVWLVATVRTGRPFPPAYRESLRAADRVIVNSMWARERVRREKISPEKVLVIPNALLHPPPEAAERERLRAGTRQELEVPGETPVLLYPAAFRKGKNHAGLLQMVAGIRDLEWRLWLAGEGPQRKACERLVASLGLGGRVRFLGFREDPRPLFCGADVVISYSHEESLPNALMEAQACGRPVLAWDTAGTSEVVLGGVSGYLIHPGDEPAYLLALREALLQAGTRAKMGRDGAVWSRQFPAVETQAGRYLEVLSAGSHS